MKTLKHPKLLFFEVILIMTILLLFDATFTSCKKDKNSSTPTTTQTPTATNATTLNISFLQICNGQNKLSILPKCHISFYYDAAHADTSFSLFETYSDSTGKYTFIGKEPRMYFYRAWGTMSTGNCVGKNYVKTGTFELRKDVATNFQLVIE